MVSDSALVTCLACSKRFTNYEKQRAAAVEATIRARCEETGR